MEGEDGLAIPQRRVFQFLSIIYFTLKSCGTNRVIQRQFLRIFLPFFFFFLIHETRRSRWLGDDHGLKMSRP